MSQAEIELSYGDFVRARKLYRKKEAKKLTDDVKVPTIDKVELGVDGSNFMVYSAGPAGVFAVFEDDGENGWFYSYDANGCKIVRYTHVYHRSTVEVVDEVIDMGRAADDAACGLAVWGQFRAFLGVSTDLLLRKPVRSSDEEGIYSVDWPAGFEHYLEKKIE